MRTAYLEIVEGERDVALASGKVTFTDATVVPRFPDCQVTGDEGDPARNVRALALRCPGGLTGRTVTIDGLGPVLTEAVVRIVRPDRTVLSHILTRDRPAWRVPGADPSWLAIGAQYVRLGVEHIATGLDHLLFLLALVLLVRRPRAVLVTETAFTLSHSISYSATALGLVHASAPAAEACIALSLVLVALDIGQPGRALDAAVEGPIIALVFGLVHGLGFAGALSDVGLPDHAVASALVGFGLGVEIGQVAFLAVVLGALALLARTAWVPRVALAGAYLVGAVGSYWFVQRLWVCLA